MRLYFGLYVSLSFNSASRQHHEVWALQLPVLQTIKNSVPHSKACTYGGLNLNLGQVQQ